MKRGLLFLSVFTTYFGYSQVVQSDVDQLDFGQVMYETPTTQMLQLTNLTDEEVQIEEFVFYEVYESSPFEVIDAPSSIPANGSVSIEIQFDPIHNIDHNTELIVKTSGDRGSISIDLRGVCEYPGNYYDLTHDLLDDDLKEAFQDILNDGTTELSYGGARDEMFMEIDNQRVNGQGSVENRLTRAYLGTDAVGYSSRQDAQSNYGLNTEHTFPQGQFNSNFPMQSDIHHLFPTDGDANSARGSLRFGNVVSGVDWSEGGSQRGFNSSGEQVFEPRDGQKGRSARAILYFLLRYQNFGGHVSADMESTVIDWHNQFPPNEIDVQRSEDIFAVQGSRNPLADYPQFVNRIFSFRTDEDRPNIGELVVSDEEVSFGLVQGDEVTYNVILTNIGERFFNVSSVDVAGTGFSLIDDQADSFVILPGESSSIQVQFDPNLLEGLGSGNLTFNTNLDAFPSITIPLSAEGLLALQDLSDLDIVMYPNPAREEFYLKGNSSDIDDVIILDMMGRVVKEFSNSQTSYPLNSLENGVYLVEVLMNNGTIGIQRLVLQP
ncbi:MAG: endonuclease [Bacteroidota bacterium]